MDQDAVIKQAIENIQTRRAAQAARLETSAEQTKRLFHWNGRDKWEYKGDFIRGRRVLSCGLPHLFESALPVYMMSKAQLRTHGLKPGAARPIAFTYNQKAFRYELYDIRHCTPVRGAEAKARRSNALFHARQVDRAKAWRKGWDVVIEALEKAGAND